MARRPRRGNAPQTVNEAFLDALVRHQIFLLRLSGGLRERVWGLLDATEKDIAKQIRTRLAGMTGGATPANLRRLQALQKIISATRARAWDQVDNALRTEMLALARAEPSFVDGQLKTVSPAVLNTILPDANTLRSIVLSRPFEGDTLKGWAKKLRRADIERIEQAIKIGVVQGQTSAQIARRVVGTAALKGRNGVTQITRNNASSLVRTATMSMSNAARSEYFQANGDLFTEEMIVATLDERTTPICRSLDGERFPLGLGPIPPLHWGCRSLRVAVISDEAIGNRPARAFTQKELLRQFASRNGIATPRTRLGLPRGLRGKFDQFARVRMREMTGQVPAALNYEEWLTRQSAGFQDDVLGSTRGALFRRGGLDLDRFVDRNTGKQYTLAELARDERRAFIRAGLNPDDFD